MELIEQPYVGRRESITMTEFARVADHLPGMFADLVARGAPIAGSPFFRRRDVAEFLEVDMVQVARGGVFAMAPADAGRAEAFGHP